MKKTRKIEESKIFLRGNRRSNPLAVTINGSSLRPFMAFEHLLSSYINFRGSRPCPTDALPYQIESPLSALINQRQPTAYQEVLDPCESPLWEQVNAGNRR